uniref:Uncharacterized protein n=1 Tax=Ixodes ricinus TaxID=34613 RepID=A0A6B0UXU4_IXORI
MCLALTFLLGRGSRSLRGSPSYCETECRLSCLLMKVALPASYIMYETVYTSRKQIKPSNLSTDCVCSLVKLGSMNLSHFSISRDMTGNVNHKCFRAVQFPSGSRKGTDMVLPRGKRRDILDKSTSAAKHTKLNIGVSRKLESTKQFCGKAHHEQLWCEGEP